MLQVKMDVANNNNDAVLACNPSTLMVSWMSVSSWSRTLLAILGAVLMSEISPNF